MAKVIIFVLLTQVLGQRGMFPFIMKLPVQSGWSPGKNPTPGKENSSQTGLCFDVGLENGCSRQSEGFIKESGGETFSLLEL